MRKFLKRAFSISSILVIAFFFFVNTQNHVDHNTLRIEGFYQEEKNSIDVAMIGASEVFTGFSSGLAYGEYGFTSYPYAIDSNNGKMFISQIKEILRCQKPKCIVIETAGIRDTFDKKLTDEQLAIMRQYTDVMPFSDNKIDIINEFAGKDKLSYYVPALAHCGKPENFENTIERYTQKFKGCTYLKGITTTNSKQKYDRILDVNNDLKTKALSDTTYSTLNDLLDYCEKLDCKVIFARFPHRITDEDGYDKLKQHNEIGRVIKERGFDFINFDHAIQEIGLDLENDFYSDSHLNAHGQIKLTKYFGGILSNQYGIDISALSQQNKERWDKSYEYTKLFYKNYDLHENDPVSSFWRETPELIKELDSLKQNNQNK